MHARHITHIHLSRQRNTRSQKYRKKTHPSLLYVGQISDLPVSIHVGQVVNLRPIGNRPATERKEKLRSEEYSTVLGQADRRSAEPESV
jgi:hypothetical protein